MHAPKGTPWPVFDTELTMPVGFYWGSDIPHAGNGFESWMSEIKKIDSTGDILILRSFYFGDEASSIEAGIQLGKKRIARMIQYLELDSEKVMKEILPAPIAADVRSRPFEGIRYEVITYGDVIKRGSDTLELCFPLKDSLLIPGELYDQLHAWIENKEIKDETVIHVVGTADGSGISESADVAWERALMIESKLASYGIEEEIMEVSTGQRNDPVGIRNRCVVIYFE